MLDFDMNKVFPVANIRPRRESRKRKYDVRITLTKNGNGGDRIRFAFINKGASMLKNVNYLRVGDVLQTKDYVVFKTFHTKIDRKAKKLIKSSKNGTGVNISEMVTAEQEKQFRTKWIGKEFPIHYDYDTRLLYICLWEAM